MSEQQHTPGPWKIDNYSDPIFISSLETGVPVAKVYKKRDALQVANARLIADAPMLKEQRDELLEVLEGMMCVCREWPDPKDEQAIADARDAISKARGKS